MSTIGQTKQPNLRRSQAGMVSIMVTMILMIVISLIVVGFAQISRRNQRQQLDRQLSTQAFYAAEAGVNDVAELIRTATVTVPAKPDCTSTSSFYSSLNATLDAPHDVTYSCLTVDPTPTTLRYNGVGTNSIVVPIISANGTGINSITLNWQTTKNTATPTAGCPSGTANVFTPNTGANWPCGYGVLRIDLVPVSGALTQAGMQGADMASFLVPQASGGSSTMSYSPGNNKLVGVSCTNSGCAMNINSGLGGPSYYMRISSLYNGANLQIGTGNNVALRDAQAIVDSTGKAQDVLRRIQVRLPLGSNTQNALSDYAIQSTDSVCKRFAVTGGGYFDSQAGGASSSPLNPLCN
ncbi:MAG TPA: PilX N-terminal domain-containing pilus assembly protein [Nevskiaceae bacterium]|nr:PilX N-terminal domain-containing pilus assembly protein [Nevskiaceae bacterium]